MSLKKATYWIAPALSAAALASSSAWGAPPAAAAAPAAPVISPAHDLSVEEATRAIRDFSDGTEGAKPQERARLFGRVHSDCISKLEITNTSKDSSMALQGVIGFTLRDKGGFMSCELSLASVKCSNNSTCVSLSQQDGASLDLAGKPHVKVALLRTDPEADQYPLKADELPTPIEHVSADELNAIRIAAEKKEREAKIKLFKSQVSSCRKSTDDLSQAQIALQSLNELGALKEGEFEKLDKELRLADLALVCQRADKAKLDELDEVREDLLSWASSNTELPKAADLVGTCEVKMADRCAEAAKQGKAEMSTCKDILRETKELDGLSDKATQALEAREWSMNASEFEQRLERNPYDWKAMQGLAQAREDVMKNMQDLSQAENPDMDAIMAQSERMRALDCAPVIAVTKRYQSCTRQMQMRSSIGMQAVGPSSQAQCGADPSTQMQAGACVNSSWMGQQQGGFSAPVGYSPTWNQPMQSMGPMSMQQPQMMNPMIR